MNTFQKYLDSRKGIILNNEFNTKALYRNYTQFAQERGEEPLLYKQVEKKLDLEIRRIQHHWNINEGFRIEQYLDNYSLKEDK